MIYNIMQKYGLFILYLTMYLVKKNHFHTACNVPKIFFIYAW